MTLISLLKYFLIWQAAIIVVTVASAWFLPLREQNLIGTQAYLENPLLASRANFDGVHYLWIADNGYGFGEQAFFPLYPKLVSLLRPLFATSLKSGVVVSSTAFLAGLYFFARLARLDHSPEVTKLAVLVLLFFPVSFFFSFVYTEGLFFLLLILSFYAARTKHWWLAGLFGAAASYTRFVGIFLFPALLVEWWQQSKKISNLVPILLVPTGLLIFSSYLLKTTGDPLAFFHIQSQFGQGRSDKIVLLYQVFWRSIKQVATVNRADPIYLTIVLEFLAGIVFLTTTLLSFIKHRFSYALFNLAAFVTPTLTGNLASLPRYVLVCFPSFLLLAKAISRLPQFARRLLAISASIFIFIYLSLFVRGYWVA